jgi:exoribonuclease II
MCRTASPINKLMNALFEDDGQLKFGTILSTSDASAQIELVGGRRIKVKSINVLFRFDAQSIGATVSKAETVRAEIDLNLLWESAAQNEERNFTQFAHDYFGETASIEQTAGTLLALHSAPMYFYKRGKGIYKPAPADSLKAALAGVERKAREAEQVAAWVDELVAGRAPESIAKNWLRLLHAPDKQSLEYKALMAAVEKARTAPVPLLAKAGVIASTHSLHYGKFLLSVFPKGTQFPDVSAATAPAGLVVADVSAFSIDDDGTTEIDDAFSVSKTATGHRIGIHIAAPALGIAIDSPLDGIARDRLSTVYMPGNKITMLPDHVCNVYSLDAGRSAPAISLYLDVDAALEVERIETRIEQIAIAENLRIPALEASTWMDAGDESVPFASELRLLYRLAAQLQGVRGEQTVNRIDYNFVVTGDPESPDARIDIKPRARGSAIDVIVSELMIYANVAWAKLLGDRGAPGMFRVQAGGKTKMSSLAGAHEGLNVPHYLWATSPLRRYADLVNQRQIIAATQNQSLPYVRGDAKLLGAIADFDTTYGLYGDFQQQMEFYWCLRFIAQEKIERLTATVIRENLVRFDSLPLVQRINEMSHQEPGVKVLLAVGEIDLYEPALHLRFVDKIG